MTRTRTSVDELKDMHNVASPHERIDGEVVAVPHRNIDNVAPAGSILSSVRDMARWMNAMLGCGALGDTRIVSESVVAEVWKPSVVYPLPESYRKLFPSTHFSTYGLGWGLRDFRGRLIATHTGGIDGMFSIVLLVPEEQLGIVVLTNTSPMGSFAHNAIAFDLADRYLGAHGDTDWSAAFREMATEQEAQQKEARRKRDAARVPGTSPRLPLERYAGEYEDPMYGTVRVTLEDGGLVLRRHTNWVADLEHWHHDTFLARWRDPVMAETLITFRMSAMGEIESIEGDVFTFERKLPAEKTP